MKIKYTPSGSETTYDWDFRPGKLLGDVLEVIEEQTGMTYNEWVTAVESTSYTALKGYVWAMMRADVDRSITYRSLKFTMDEIEYDYDDDELRALLERLRARVADDEGEDLSDGEEALLVDLAERFPDVTPLEVVDPDEPATKRAAKKAAPGPKA